MTEQPTPTYPKPQPSARGDHIAYRELTAYLEHVHRINAGDFYNKSGHYPAWCAKHHLPSNPTDIGEKQRIFQKYNTAPGGAANAPKYANFHDWLMDLHRGDSPTYKTMTVMNLNTPKILATYDNEKHDERIARLRAGTLGPNEPPMDLMPVPYGRGLPTFVKTILAHLQTDFGNVVKLSFK